MLTPPKLQHRYGSAISLDNKLYVCGGADPGSDDVEVYDEEKDVWSLYSAKLPTKLGLFTMASVKDWQV